MSGQLAGWLAVCLPACRHPPGWLADCLFACLAACLRAWPWLAGWPGSVGRLAGRQTGGRPSRPAGPLRGGRQTLVCSPALYRCPWPLATPTVLARPASLAGLAGLPGYAGPRPLPLPLPLPLARLCPCPRPRPGPGPRAPCPLPCPCPCPRPLPPPTPNPCPTPGSCTIHSPDPTPNPCTTPRPCPTQHHSFKGSGDPPTASWTGLVSTLGEVYHTCLRQNYRDFSR